ncbi:hypothetical protein BT63DRAFT_255775 [Microthyrium microscopicum]|uniref:Uncharacterized protein n=1 Tax=Microthyrium microscopicum TaxID=703497 RepID=A0A6A6UBC1_9PEZI|nr:hypothetical protein BT63DRAFT_255775 [Microthyrium microscopicum]
MASALCPHDTRCDGHDMFLKLFALQLTVIVAYCHLLRIRKETITFWTIFFIVIYPPLLFLRYALAVFLLLAAKIWNILSPDSYHKFDTAQATLYLFGTIPINTDKEALPLSKVQSPPPTPSRLHPARILFLCVFVAQCASTINHSSQRSHLRLDRIPDRRAFDLACTGISIALPTILPSILHYPFRSPMPPLTLINPPLPASLINKFPSQYDAQAHQDWAIYLRTRTPSSSLSYLMLLLRDYVPPSIVSPIHPPAHGLEKLIPGMCRLSRSRPCIVLQYAPATIALIYRVSAYADHAAITTGWRTLYGTVVMSAVVLDHVIARFYTSVCKWLILKLYPRVRPRYMALVLKGYWGLVFVPWYVLWCVVFVWPSLILGMELGLIKLGMLSALRIGHFDGEARSMLCRLGRVIW